MDDGRRFEIFRQAIVDRKYGKPFTYAPGVVAVIPEGIRHRIVADREDVYLFAKFFPALL